MKQIFLIRNKYTLVDDEDFEQLNRWKWSYAVIRGKEYVTRQIGKRGIRLQTLKIHSMILGKKNGFEIDHIDGNGLNNQKSNLRFVTHQQNGFNLKIGKHNKSGFKGVYWHKQNQKWCASIGFNYKQYFLGLFKFKKDAAIAYNIAASKYFGEFAKLNKLSW